MSTANLKIGFVFDDTLDSNDGVAQYVKVLGSWLNSQGHDVSYIVGQSSAKTWAGGDVYSVAKNLKLKWGGNRLSMPVWPDKKKIKRLLKSQNYDILHVQMPYSPLMAQYVINHAPARASVIGTFHVFPANRWAKVGAKLLRIVYGYSLRRFSKILSVSPAAASYGKDSFKITSAVLPNVVAISEFKSRRKIELGRIVFLGRLVERKGCQQLLHAFNLVHAMMPQAKLTIAGDGPLRPHLEKYVVAKGLGDSVEFLGFIDEKEKPDILAQAAVACFPSLYGESFGIVLIEAMAAGSGVVLGGDNPGYADVLGKQERLLINPRNKEEFASRLVLLLNDPKLAAKLHTWQVEEVKRYDVNHVGSELVGIYRRAIALKNKNEHNNN